jgi:hypothetical protein
VSRRGLTVGQFGIGAPNTTVTLTATTLSRHITVSPDPVTHSGETSIRSTASRFNQSLLLYNDSLSTAECNLFISGVPYPSVLRITPKSCVSISVNLVSPTPTGILTPTNIPSPAPELCARFVEMRAPTPEETENEARRIIRHERCIPPTAYSTPPIWYAPLMTAEWCRSPDATLLNSDNEWDGDAEVEHLEENVATSTFMRLTFL